MTESTDLTSALAGKGLSRELIDELMAGSRGRNVYGPKLKVWLEDSDEPAVNPAEVWPVEFGSKKATALYQGFLTAAKAAEIHESQDGPVKVLNRDGKVYLFHMERIAALPANDES
jgi:hypothetical protein